MTNRSRKFVRWLTKKMPKRLYARSLIIIIAPMVLLQTVIGYVFMERHWQMVTERLSTAVVHDISAIIDIIETYPQQDNYEDIKRIAQQRMGLNISILPPTPSLLQDLSPFLQFLIIFSVKKSPAKLIALSGLIQWEILILSKFAYTLVTTSCASLHYAAKPMLLILGFF